LTKMPETAKKRVHAISGLKSKQTTLIDLKNVPFY